MAFDFMNYVWIGDLNPVASLLTWASLNIVGGGKEIAEEVQHAQRKVYEAVDHQMNEWGIEHREPDLATGRRWRADAYLYCTEVTCPLHRRGQLEKEHLPSRDYVLTQIVSDSISRSRAGCHRLSWRSLRRAQSKIPNSSVLATRKTENGVALGRRSGRCAEMDAVNLVTAKACCEGGKTTN
jgi:hypothetical protein